MVNSEILRIQHERGRPTMEYMPPWAERDIFSKQAITELAHQRVEARHHRTLGRINRWEKKQKDIFTDRAEAASHVEDKLISEFMKSSRSPEQERQDFLNNANFETNIKQFVSSTEIEGRVFDSQSRKDEINKFMKSTSKEELLKQFKEAGIKPNRTRTRSR